MQALFLAQKNNHEQVVQILEMAPGSTAAHGDAEGEPEGEPASSRSRSCILF